MSMKLVKLCSVHFGRWRQTVPNVTLPQLQEHYDALCEARLVLLQHSYTSDSADGLIPYSSTRDCGQATRRASSYRIRWPFSKDIALDSMGGRCCCCSSNTCCSDCRNTVFQASPRHSIASIANVIHAKPADPRNDNSAHGSRITVSNAACVTDTLRDRNPDKASAASTVINSSRPLFAAI